MEQFGRINFTDELFARLKTPCYLVNENQLEENLRLIHSVQEAAGCKILLAFKGFAMWSAASLVNKYLTGVSASSLNEALLGKEKFEGELHVYSPAYLNNEFEQIASLANHIVFNSPSQWLAFREHLPHGVKAALRINPEHREAETELYDPCAIYSRLGTTLSNFMENIDELKGISGIHFHNLCELNSDALERTLAVVEEKFSFYFKNIQWINFGGGHHITRPDYDIERLVRIIRNFKKKHNLEVYLEPGEAIALNTGVLVSRVVDVFKNGMDIAILDTSATAHMPDVLEMPYRPHILNASKPGVKPFTYRLGGLTCLAGDIIGDYSFDFPLTPGDTIVFGDMAHYTMVKTSTFNGVNLPSIYLYNSNTDCLTHERHFGYGDFKNRLS